MKQTENTPLDIINMADWLASKQADRVSTVRFAFSEKIRLSRHKPGNTGKPKLTRGQRRTILNHVSLPDEFFARLIIEEFGYKISRFTAQELIDLQKTIEEAAHYAKGLVRGKLLCVVEKLSDIRSKVSKRVQDRFCNSPIVARFPGTGAC